MTEIRLEGLRKSYGTAAHAVNGLDLAIASGEFITLLGPSGCGKSTTLRMIAGLEEPTAGAILFDGKRVERLAPAARNVAMVFQNYALYPHMTVRGNLDYPLRKRGVVRKERDRRIAAVVSVLQLEPLLARRPRQLSGGQQQRVALGRAMIREPQVFLFDEPLSNLDAQLRTGMRAELIRLHRRLKRTMVYVTHDQLEAMTMSDRIAVMRAGDLQQVGAPAEIYAQPANRFVASFVGTPAMNFFDGRLERAEDGATAFVAAGLSLALSQAHEAGDVAMGVRPEHVTIGEGQDRAEVTVVEPTGHETLVILRTAAGDLVARQPGDARVQAGEVVPFAIDASRVHLFDVNTGFRIPTREASRA